MQGKIKSIGNSIYTVVLALIVVFSATVVITGNITMSHNNVYLTRHTITVDGNASDWTGTPPSQANSWVVSNGEWIWKDAIGDERNDFNYSGTQPDTRVDLTEFRVTGDSTYLYFMAKFYDLDNGSTLHLGDNGATWMAIAIDNGTNGGETWFAGESDTQVNSSAAWEYQIVINLADSRYTGKGLKNTTHPLNESTANWGSIFYVVNNTWKFMNYTGDTGQHGLMAVNMTSNVIEIKVAWSVLGIDVTTSPTISISVITARGWSDYSNNQGHTWDSPGNSDALDCITITGPNTWDEVQDGVVDDYAMITFDSSGEVSGGSFIPEFSLFIPIIFIAIPVILNRKN